MAKSVLDIVIRTIKEGGADKETIKGLVGIKTAFQNTVVTAGAFVASGVAVVKMLDSFIREAAESEKVNAQLNAVLASTGHAAGMAYEELDNLASSLARVSTYDDDAIKSSEALLLTFTKVGREVFPAAQQSILDMSTALGTDLKNSTIQIGKALNDPIKGITALSKAGVSFTEEQKTLIRTMVESGDVMGAQRLILAELETEFGGSAAAALDTYDGKLQRLNNQWGDLKERMGGGLIGPATDLVEQANMAMDGWGQFFDYMETRSEIGEIWGNMADEAARLGEAEPTYDMAVQKWKEMEMAQRSLEQATLDNSAAAQELQTVIEEIDYSNLLSMTLNLQDGYDRFAEKETEIKQKMEEVNAEFATGAINAAEQNKRLDELTGELQANQEAMEQWSKKTVFALAQARLAANGLDANEFAFLIGLGEEMGIIDEKTADMAASINDSLSEIDAAAAAGDVKNFSNIWRDLLKLPHEQSFSITTTNTTVLKTTTTAGTPYPSGSACFLAGTEITLANGNQRSIEDMRVGDLVLTMNPQTGETESGRVKHVFVHDVHEYYKISLSNGKSISVTGEHPLWSGTAWIEARNFGTGWTMRDVKNEPLAVVFIFQVRTNVRVYNIEVDHEWHTYFAEGVLAHNKATGGIVRAPGDGLQDTVMVPMANGEGVLNARAMAQPGAVDLLRALNAGASLPGGSSGEVTIYGGVTIVAQGSVRSALDDLSKL